MAVGYQSLYSNTNGNDNIAVGYQSLYSNASGYMNTAVGYQSLYSNASGIYNIAIGMTPLYSNTTGGNNTVIGNYALHQNTTAHNNVAIGYETGRFNQTGADNVFLGKAAGYGADSVARSASNYNLAIGSEAGYSLSANSSGNIFLGYRAGYNETGSNKLYIDNGSAPGGSAFIYGDMSSDLLTFNANVGIGKTSPTAWLDISGATTSKPSVRVASGTAPSSPVTGDIYNNGTSLYYYNGSTWQDLGLDTDTTGTATIAGSGLATQVAFFSGSTSISGSNNLWWDNTSGNLGIGTSAPTAKLMLAGSADTEQFVIRANATQTSDNPLIQLQSSTGTPLLSIHSDN